ncbi:hypothetical protein [Spirosoma profusum]|nr:hypothetical protein [Spirosoma profusum]
MIEIQYSVTLPTSYVAYCQRASMTATGRIRYESGARLSFRNL